VREGVAEKLPVLQMVALLAVVAVWEADGRRDGVEQSAVVEPVEGTVFPLALAAQAH
jgi:hypothetical protein